MKLRINRKKWLRGKPFEGTLFDGEKSCCLGFYGRAIGFKNASMYDAFAPNDFIERVKNEKIQKRRFSKWKSLVYKYDGSCYLPNKVCDKLTTFNDTELITDKNRESKIKYWFKKIGVDVEFYN